jgi:hypothetical protein
VPDGLAAGLVERVDDVVLGRDVERSSAARPVLDVERRRVDVALHGAVEGRVEVEARRRGLRDRRVDEDPVAVDVVVHLQHGRADRRPRLGGAVVHRAVVRAAIARGAGVVTPAGHESRDRQGEDRKGDSMDHGHRASALSS